MIKFVTTMVVLSFFAISTHAETWGERAESIRETWSQGSDSVRLLFGAQSGANHYGFDYEHRMGVAGFGLFYLQANESAALSRPEYMTLGIVAPIHVLDRSMFDVYIAPGVNATQFNDHLLSGATEEDDFTAWGATLKVGVLYYCTKNWNWGLDFIKIHNLNESKLADEDELVSFALGYTW